jgi:AmiR/NasT family two-component response regulator
MTTPDNTWLQQRVEELESENEQLRTALDTRIILEQAKGVLSERLDLLPDEAFELIRAAARRSRIRVHDLAAEIVGTHANPHQIEDQIVRLRNSTPRG